MSTEDQHTSKGRLLGDAYIRCMPEVTGFAARVQAKLDEDRKPENPERT